MTKENIFNIMNKNLSLRTSIWFIYFSKHLIKVRVQIFEAAFGITPSCIDFHHHIDQQSMGNIQFEI